MNNKKELITQMLSIQNTVNANVDEDWKLKNREWYRACYVEASELMESVCYKWWRKTSLDLNNAVIECIDCFHFILSGLIEENADVNSIINSWYSSSSSKSKDIKLATDKLIFSLLKVKFEGANYLSVVESFSELATNLDLSLEDIYIYYIGKATLNNFRQNNGYKEGTYKKQWASPLEPNNTVEDNVILTIILNDYLGSQDLPDNLQSIIYKRLTKDYSY